MFVLQNFTAKQAEKRRYAFYHLRIKLNMQSGLSVVRGCCKMESSSSLFHLNNLMCCIWHGELFGATMGGAEVYVCPHIPLVIGWPLSLSY